MSVMVSTVVRSKHNVERARRKAVVVIIGIEFVHRLANARIRRETCMTLASLRADLGTITIRNGSIVKILRITHWLSRSSCYAAGLDGLDSVRCNGSTSTNSSTAPRTYSRPTMPSN